MRGGVNTSTCSNRPLRKKRKVLYNIESKKEIRGLTNQTQRTQEQEEEEHPVPMTWTRLHDACQRQDSQLVIQLLSTSKEEMKMMLEMEMEGEEDECPAAAAAAAGMTMYVSEALMHDEHNSTPLHIAVWNCAGSGKTSVILALIDACPQAVTDKDILGNTPIHVGASHPNTNSIVMKALLDASIGGSKNGASITNKEGLTPLHMACRHAPTNEHVIGLLLEAYPEALWKRTRMGDPAPSSRRVVRKNGSSSGSTNMNNDDGRYHFVTDTAGGKSNLLHTSNTGSYHWFEALKVVQHKDHIRDGSYPLHMAVEAAGAPREVIEMLIRGANEYLELNNNNNNGNNIHDKTNVLLLTNKHGETPLHIALKENDEKSSMMGSSSSSSNDWTMTVDDRGNDKYQMIYTLLHGDKVSSPPTSPKVAKKAVVKGGGGATTTASLTTSATATKKPPNVNVSSSLAHAVTRIKEKRHGNLPLHTAAQYGCSVSVAKLLLQHYPNAIHEQNLDKKTPLQLALEYNHCSDDVLRLLEISDHAEEDEDIPTVAE